MPIRYVAGDLFANEHQARAFAHGCNCQGSMGAGIAVGSASATRPGTPSIAAAAKRSRASSTQATYCSGKTSSKPWVFNLEEEKGETSKRVYWLLQQFNGERWEAQYRFTLQPHALPDFAEMCHYHQTSPQSHFIQKRVCSLATPEGRITLSDLRLITTTRGKREEQVLQSEQE